MRILVVTNLYPPLHAGTYDFRCQTVVQALGTRGHTVQVLTSTHGLRSEQSDDEIARRLWLNDRFGAPAVTAPGPLEALEAHNNIALRESLQAFQPELVHVWSLAGLSKSLIYTLGRSGLPTVYDVADDWLGAGLRTDPWLRWWNSPATNLHRASLELAGKRNRLDGVAPTRLTRGYDRMPDVCGPPEKLAQTAPNSVKGFRFERLYFCSHFLRQAAVGAGFAVGHGEVIHPGVATQIYFGAVRPVAEPTRRLLFTGRLDERCGLETALQALRLAVEQGHRLTLGVYGRGDSDFIARMRSAVVLKRLPVEFLPVSDQARDLAGVFRLHDVFLHTPEVAEPFAVTPLEAMASGLPVIAAELGGVTEALRHGENVLTFAPGNYEQLAERIALLVRQPELRVQLAERGQADAQGQGNETLMVDCIEQFLVSSLAVWQVQ